jgi:four helix bundle protein
MGARSYKELTAWQRADVVRGAVLAVAKREHARMDVRFREQWCDAASSVCANLAEGFGRYSHRDFARFVRQARGSLFETENFIGEARQRGHLTPEEEADLNQLIRRATVPITRLLHYLTNTPDPHST